MARHLIMKLKHSDKSIRFCQVFGNFMSWTTSNSQLLEDIKVNKLFFIRIYFCLIRKYNEIFTLITRIAGRIAPFLLGNPRPTHIVCSTLLSLVWLITWPPGCCPFPHFISLSRPLFPFPVLSCPCKLSYRYFLYCYSII